MPKNKENPPNGGFSCLLRVSESHRQSSGYEPDGILLPYPAIKTKLYSKNRFLQSAFFVLSDNQLLYKPELLEDLLV